MQFIPAEDYRYAFRKDDVGTDVAILQMNLPDCPVDGVFGDVTEKKVKSWQRRNKLVVDGIAGIATSRSIISVRSRQVTQFYGLPKGMLKSISFNESSFIITNAGRHAGDDGWDAGAFARSSGRTYGDEAFYESAFNVLESAEWTAKNSQKQYELYANPVDSRYLDELAYGDKQKFRWQLTILSHNWPVGALNICRNGRATSDDDAPAAWVEEATKNPSTGVSSLHTPRQWVMSYVIKANEFIQWT